jgi:dihydropteroate synthase
MAGEGADIIDIGAESTRPGAENIPAGEQIDRVRPVIRGLKEHLPKEIVISIDTRLAEVAESAIQSGAAMINDISAGRDDAGIFELAAKHDLPLVLMHMQGTPQTMQESPVYENIIREIQEFLQERIQTARMAGVADGNIIIDPGLGFGKTLDHNLEVIRKLPDLVEMGYPLLLGASRKRFLQGISQTRNVTDLCGATCAITAIGMMAGVSLFRVHDVLANRQTLDVMYQCRS